MAGNNIRKPVSTLNGLRAGAFFSGFALTMTFIIGGSLLGTAVAHSPPYVIAALVLAYYITRDLFGFSPSAALFASDAEINAQRAARRGESSR
jgi:hypothetical protein